MIKKFIDKLLGKGPAANHAKAADFGKRVEVGPAVHGIDPDLVDERARNVVATLRQAGYEAYIVGGAVRDLLLGLKPKDFDVATNATPEQVKGLFRRAFIIGRRFRIVHVVYGRGRDNVWGSQIEDAARRDFTINAMYYEPSSQIVVDYHRGIRDAERRVLRMIGDPATRYREDPVRIIRAARFAAKLAALGFRLDPKTAAPLQRSLPLLAQVPQSRLFDEMLKLLQTGHALATIAELRELGVAHGIYPLLDLVVDRADQPFVHAALEDTDRRVDEGKPVAPSFLLACVLWADVRDGWSTRIAAGQPSFPALQDAIDGVFDARIGDVSGRGRLAGDMREIWMMQPRFEKRSGNTPRSLVEQPRFRAGFDFLRLRADTGEVDEALAAWWQEFSIAHEDGRARLLEQVRAQPRAARRRRGRAGSSDAQRANDEAETPPSQDAAGADRDAGTPHVAEAPNGTPKKRRRRRRSNASNNIATSADNTRPAAGNRWKN